MCPRRTADGTKCAVKMERRIVIFCIQMQSGGAHLHTLLLFHLSFTPLCWMLTPAREWCRAAWGHGSLSWNDMHKAHTNLQKHNSLKRNCSLYASGLSRLNFSGMLAWLLMQMVQMERLQPGCEEKKCHWGLCNCRWWMQLASMHYSMIECSKEDLPDSHWRMDLS